MASIQNKVSGASALIPIFTTAANIARHQVKCKSFTERALCLSPGRGPASTLYPVVRALGCLSDKYGLVCSMYEPKFTESLIANALYLYKKCFNKRK